MNKPSATPKAKLQFSRIALILATVVALAAIGLQIYRSYIAEGEKTVTTISSEQAPNAEKIIAELETKLRDNPADTNGWQMLGWSYFELKRFSESAEAMKRATSLNPANAEYWSMLGEALVMAGDGQQISEEAAGAFQKAVINNPQDARARYFLAVQKDVEGDHKGAIDDWFALLEDTPADAPYAADVRRIIQQVAGKEGVDVKDRLAALAPAVAAGPSPEQIKETANLSADQQQAMIAGMVDGLAAKLKTNPDNAEGWVMLMRSHMQLGQTDKASQAKESALKAFSKNNAKTKQIRDAAAKLGVK